jgi:hypothetical protein
VQTGGKNTKRQGTHLPRQQTRPASGERTLYPKAVCSLRQTPSALRGQERGWGEVFSNKSRVNASFDSKLWTAANVRACGTKCYNSPAAQGKAALYAFSSISHLNLSHLFSEYL